ncbi:hypothetical protein CERSUDRAFT_94290 [Gelatoporia subvermispora B]|uniref:Cytochrome P450 n=1 Tax=Ceriporiopsis subvermispora (strain B) TaxID=914234 RepID=M2QYQ3_CERS8|nr:hypothetical protein CERSUDRAFT_94290 [Gelatoporia subvermispora B]
MPSTALLDALAAAAAIAILAAWLFRRQHSSRLPLPPGPPRLPILGNALDVVANGASQAYLKMGQKLGSDIICLDAMGMHLVILNSREAATDLLEKRSTIYSDRPWMTMICELIGLGWSLPLAPYGDDWKLSRKMFHHELNLGTAEKFRDMERTEAHVLLYKLLHRPEEFLGHIRHLVGATIVRMAYGIDAQPEDDPYVRLAEDAIQGPSQAATPGTYLVDTWPILKHLPSWFPGAGFKRDAVEFRRLIDTLLNTPYENMQDRMRKGETPDCAASSLLEVFGDGISADANTERVLKNTLASMYIAGTDTSVSTLSTFFLAMVLNPEVQAKAQMELDAVSGGHRLPVFTDQVSMPYITAIMMESLRWKPVVPLNLPHMSTEGGIYRGYYIPKGSIVCSNDWAILHDERVYPNPSAFDPDRFMKDGAINAEVPHPETAAFGFGRRICPGRYMAHDMLWITIASVLAIFTISKEVNDAGEEVMPETCSLPGFLSHPKPFKCTIKPRSQSHVALVEDATN